MGKLRVASPALCVLSAVITLGIAVAFSMTCVAQTHAPAASKKKAVSARMSKQFRKSALLAKLAFDEALSHAMDKNVRASYDEDAKKALTVAKADADTPADTTCYGLLVEYEISVLHYETEELKQERREIAANWQLLAPNPPSFAQMEQKADQEYKELYSIKSKVEDVGACLQEKLDNDKCDSSCVPESTMK